MKQPCKKDCPNRSPTCHSECERYLEFARDCQDQREERRKRQIADGYIASAVRASRKSVGDKR